MYSTGQLEIAHVLFLDLVGYSRLALDLQSVTVERLQEAIRRAPTFREAEAAGQMISLPTGDGAALVFFSGPEAPVRCALEIARQARSGPPLPLRMGIHSGGVYRLRDLNAGASVTGDGINLAQRVMDCGDDGHILVSASVAELLRKLTPWTGAFQDLGECAVKHGEVLHLYNLCTADAGNPAPPARRQAEARAAAAEAGTPVSAGEIVLLYRRHVQPDEEVLLFLEAGLRAVGHRVFIDRHLKVGVAWAQEIERRVRGAAVVVPLLSAASVQSEMLACELEIAREAAELHGGKPRLLPVRLGFTGALPEPLARVLDPIQYALWESPADSPRVLAELREAIASPAPTSGVGAAELGRPPEAARSPETPGAEGEMMPSGAVPLGSRLYLEREADPQFLRAIARRESLVLLKGARQMGKTSLLARGLQHARELGAQTMLTDLQKLTATDLETADRFFYTMAEWLADQLDLDVLPSSVWNPDRSPSLNFERYVRRCALEATEAPLVWGLDEVDRLFTCPFGSDVFGLFRSWHNERSSNPQRPWGRLTLAIAYATEAHLFITDVNQSPFNVGVRLALEDFGFEQVGELNRRQGAPLRSEAELARFFRLVSGHPYLVQRGLYEMRQRRLSIGELESLADRDEGIFGDHLRRILVSLSRDPALCDVVRGVLRGRACPNEESFYRLRSAGVLAGDSARSVRPRCQLYATYLERHLL